MLMPDYMVEYYSKLQQFFLATKTLRIQAEDAFEIVLSKEHSPRLLSFKDFDKTSDTVSFDLKRVCRLTHDYVFYLYKLYLEYRGRQPFQTIDALQESTAWHILVGDAVLSIIKDNFDLLKEYRNDVMHAHNIVWEKYKKAKQLFTSANDALEKELSQLLQYPSMMQLSGKTASTLYDKITAFNANTEKIGDGMAAALEIFAKIADASIPSGLSANAEKIIQILSSATLDSSAGQLPDITQPKTDCEVKKDE